MKQVFQGIKCPGALSATHNPLRSLELGSMDAEDGFTFGALGVHTLDKLAYFLVPSKRTQPSCSIAGRISKAST